MRRTIARQVAFIVVCIVTVETLAIVALTSWSVFSVREQTHNGLVNLMGRLGELERCDQNPEAWLHPIDGVGMLFAVDDAGHPYPPKAPYINAGPADPNRTPAFTLIRMENEFGTLKPLASLRETGRAGPCHRFVMSTEALKPAGFLAARIGIVLIALLVLVLAVAWPFVRRIQRMATATEEVLNNDFNGTVPTGDDELGQLGHAFNRAATAARERLSTLETRDKALRDALQRLTHDVMTPLASLKLAVEQLGDEDDIKEAKRHQTLRADVEHLNGLLANLATLARLRGSSQALIAVHLDLTEVVERVGLRMQILATDRDIALRVALPGEPIRMKGDSLALEQAIGNLVHNAVQYATGNVGVVVDASDSAAHVTVRDDGPGIDPEDLPHVFKARFQGRARPDGSPSGAGLGLAIAQEIAERHNGSLAIGPYAEGGTEVRLELPLCSPEPNTGST